MVFYSVYRADFCTAKGTKRRYVGLTANTETRLAALERPGLFQPAWCKAGFFSLRVLVGDVPSKSAGLALEALHAARAITAAPSTTRGGPWVLPSLTSKDHKEYRAAAACSTLKALREVAGRLGPGSLASHLASTTFDGRKAAYRQESP